MERTHPDFSAGGRFAPATMIIGDVREQSACPGSSARALTHWRASARVRDRGYFWPTAASAGRDLEHRNRVDWRSGPAGHANRRRDEHEFPAFQPGSRFRHRLEVQVVEEV